jgi:WD40 repeat protein
MQLHGHTDGVKSVMFSADGKRLVSGARDGSALLWDATRGTQIGEPLGQGQSRAPDVAIAGDGSVIAIAGGGAITLWDADSREQLARWPIPPYSIAGASAARAGSTLAFSGSDGSLYVIDVARRQIVRKRVAAPFSTLVGSPAVTDSGDRVATADLEGLRLWRVQTTGPRLRLQRAPIELSGDFYVRDGPDFDAAGRVLAIRGANGNLVRWDVRTGDRLADGGAVDSAFDIGIVDADTGTMVVTGDRSLGIRRGSRRTWPTNQLVTAIALAPGATRLAAGGERGTIEIWDTTRDVALGSALRSRHASAIALDPQGETLAVAEIDGDISLWNARTGEAIEPRIGSAPRRSYVDKLAFSPSRDEITAVSVREQSLSAQIWPRSPGDEPPPTIELTAFGLDPEIEFPVLSRDGSVLAWPHRDKLRIWEIPRNRARELGPIEGLPQDRFGTRLAVSADSTTIVVWNDRTIVMVPADGSSAPVRLPDFGSVRDAAVSSDMVAIALDNGALRLWDRRTSRPVGRDLGDASEGRLAFSPDGSVLVAVGGTIDAWSIPARRQIADGLDVTPAEEAVQELAFAGDPATLVALGESRPYIVDPIVFSTDLADFEERVCAIVNRNLRRDEVTGFPADREPGRCMD